MRPSFKIYSVNSSLPLYVDICIEKPLVHISHCYYYFHLWARAGAHAINFETIFSNNRFGVFFFFLLFKIVFMETRTRPVVDLYVFMRLIVISISVLNNQRTTAVNNNNNNPPGHLALYNVLKIIPFFLHTRVLTKQNYDNL